MNDRIADTISKAQAAELKPLLVSSGTFVKGFVPPDYTIDGLLLRGKLYTLTAPTGWGKTAITLRLSAHKGLGLPLHGREIDQGCVLYFAGENPEDVCMRCIKQCEEMDVSPADMDVYFMSSAPDLSSDEIRQQINAEVALIGRPITLLIVDTFVVYFTGDDETDRTQMAQAAMMFRSLTTLPGGPTVLVNCHPVKNFNPDNIVPAGGGSLLNLIDGNLVCLRELGSMVVDLSTHGKFRGPEFAPLSFLLQPGTSDRLKTSKGRLIPTVTATPISDAERDVMNKTADAEKSELLSLMREKPGLSLAVMANQLGWFYSGGKPNRSKVHRALRALMDAKLVTLKNGVWELTKAGMQAATPRAPAQGDMPFRKGAKRPVLAVSNVVKHLQGVLAVSKNRKTV
jgi:AAA domain